eukprot:m.99057 g.99057  ORF g.99057 m.99057 type:complete len:458 (+) comp9026_c0_seq2:181-1554(+)
MEFLRRFTKADLTKEEEEELEEELFALNPFNKVQVLKGHETEVRFLLTIDKSRILTVGVLEMCVWDIKVGRQVSIMEDHTYAITSVLVHQKRIISCSFDKTVKIWDPDMGQCLVTVGDIGSQLAVLKPFYGDMFCVGGDGISVVSVDGHVFAHLPEIQSDHTIDQMLCVSESTIIACSVMEKFLSSYTLERNFGVMGGIMDSGRAPSTINELRIKPLHSDKISQLERLNNLMFASGARDGSISIWSAKHITRLLSIKYVPDPSSLNAPNSNTVVGAMLPLFDDKLFAVAIGKHVRVISSVDGKVVSEINNAHKQKINCMCLVHQGTILVTCAENIRFWCLSSLLEGDASKSYAEKMKDVIRTLNSNKEGVITPWKEGFETSVPQRVFSLCERKKKISNDCLCMGEISLHEREILDCKSAGPYVFATCSVDQTVCLWQNGAYKSMNDNLAIFQHLQTT